MQYSNSVFLTPLFIIYTSATFSSIYGRLLQFYVTKNGVKLRFGNNSILICCSNYQFLKICQDPFFPLPSFKSSYLLFFSEAIFSKKLILMPTEVINYRLLLISHRYLIVLAQFISEIDLLLLLL